MTTLPTVPPRLSGKVADLNLLVRTVDTLRECVAAQASELARQSLAIENLRRQIETIGQGADAVWQ